MKRYAVATSFRNGIPQFINIEFLAYDPEDVKLFFELNDLPYADIMEMILAGDYKEPKERKRPLICRRRQIRNHGNIIPKKTSHLF